MVPEAGPAVSTHVHTGREARPVALKMVVAEDEEQEAGLAREAMGALGRRCSIHFTENKVLGGGSLLFCFSKAGSPNQTMNRTTSKTSLWVCFFQFLVPYMPISSSNIPLIYEDHTMILDGPSSFPP